MFCAILQMKLTPLNSTMYNVSVIEIFLEKCIKAILTNFSTGSIFRLDRLSLISNASAVIELCRRNTHDYKKYEIFRTDYF